MTREETQSEALAREIAVLALRLDRLQNPGEPEPRAGDVIQILVTDRQEGALAMRTLSELIVTPGDLGVVGPGLSPA